jgi:hypothetical protein
MPADIGLGTLAYLCECGKKWSIPKKNLSKGPSSFKCECGRTIVVEEGIMYSTTKATASAGKK